MHCVHEAALDTKRLKVIFFSFLFLSQVRWVSIIIHDLEHILYSFSQYFVRASRKHDSVTDTLINKKQT